MNNSNRMLTVINIKCITVHIRENCFDIFQLHNFNVKYNNITIISNRMEVYGSAVLCSGINDKR